MKNFKLIVAYFSIVFSFNYLPANSYYFPRHFLWGTAIAEFQNSGAEHLPHSNWAAFEKKIKAPNEYSGKSVNHWELYREDITLMKKLGLNSFRFSIDWSAIEPTEETFNQAAIQHYHDLIDALIAAQITPMVTLHHFTHPQWFDEKGAFEHDENIEYFTRFCTYVFQQYNAKVKLWGTINEPAIHAYTGYFLGLHSPGKNIFNAGIQTTAQVLKNLLKAHVTVYRVLKQLPGGQEAQIGIVHNILKFAPRFSLEPAEAALARIFTYLTNDLTMEFLRTGIFEFSIMGFSSVSYYEVEAPKCFDFIGLNYYATAVIGFNMDNFFGTTHFPEQVMGDMDLPVDPQGFATAIEEIAQLGVPIYITENGMADSLDDRRPLMLQQYLTVVAQALVKGIDIRGYYHWTLIDNYEWDRGTTKKFGLFDANRTIKTSALFYKNYIAQHYTPAPSVDLPTP